MSKYVLSIEGSNLESLLLDTDKCDHDKYVDIAKKYMKNISVDIAIRLIIFLVSCRDQNWMPLAVKMDKKNTSIVFRKDKLVFHMSFKNKPV